MLLAGCSKKPDPEDIPVAKVGDRTITVGEFRRNYEFGLPHLKTGENRKLTYLNYMIMEEVLSEEGYRRGLEKSDRVKKLEQELLDELLVEELFNVKVKEKIKITPEQVREAVNKSRVQWKLRYWVEPNEFYAMRVAAAMKEQGYAPVLEDILSRNPEVQLQPKDFETDYLTWLDLSEELLDAVKNVPIGDISDPVEINGRYFIFQVTDIRRSPVSEYDYLNEYEKYRQILFYRELKKKAAAFVSDFMTPKNVVTKGPAFSKIAKALAEWKTAMDSTGTPFLASVEQAQNSNPHLYELKKSLDEPLVNFKGGGWTINDFLRRFEPKRVKADPSDNKKFMSELNQQIALNVRDYFLSREAKKMGLEKSPAVQKELATWRDKWVYEEMRRQFTQSIHADEASAKDYFEKYREKYKIRWDDEPKFNEYKNLAMRDAYIQASRNLLTAKVDSLTRLYPVKIDTAVLDTITVIESAKSRWQSLQVFKRSSNRLAVPIVDPAWGL